VRTLSPNGAEGSLRTGWPAGVLTEHWPGLAILGVYLTLAICYSLADPVYESTDEIRHVRYVRHLIVYHSLPEQGGDEGLAQSHHPPLYYALAAAASWWVPVPEEVYYKPVYNEYWGYRQWEVGDDNKNQYLHGPDERFPFGGITLAVYVMRWLNVLLGAGTVYVTYLTAREVFAGRAMLAAGASALIAFNPQFLYLSGAVNNDVAAALCSALVLLLCVRMVHRGASPRFDLAIGVLYGLALLTKLNLLALLAAIEVAYVAAAARSREWRILLRGNLIVLGLAVLLSGWWFWRNQALYGDPTGMSALNELWAGRPLSESWWALRQGLPHLWTTLWGRFGYGQVPMPGVVYAGLFWACVLALAGHLVPGSGRIRADVMLLLLTAMLSSTVVVFYYILIQPAGAMGRFLFPALPAFAVTVVGGVDRLLPSRRPQLAGLAVTGSMLGLAVYALLGVLAPAFSAPRALRASELESAPNPTEVQFGQLARIVGYSITPDETEPGGVVSVAVYWEVLSRTTDNYAVFVHLLSETGVMIAQRDTYPGLGKYPTTAWDPGVAFVDTYRLHVPDTAYAPDHAYVQVGLYKPGEARVETSDGRDAARIGEVQVKARTGLTPNPIEYDFDGVALLAGYDLQPRVARPGQSVMLTLYWQPLTPAMEGYSTCATLLGHGDSAEHCNDVGASGVSGGWEEGERADDVHWLVLDAAAAEGNRELEVTLRSPGGDAVPVVADDGHWLGLHVRIGGIVVAHDG
jgi:4-amino-4-deoxy-L-arabinose transferase-like glycosyltransferase